MVCILRKEMIHQSMNCSSRCWRPPRVIFSDHERIHRATFFIISFTFLKPCLALVNVFLINNHHTDSHWILALHQFHGKLKPHSRFSFRWIHDQSDGVQVASDRGRHTVLHTHEHLAQTTWPLLVLCILFAIIHVHDGFLPSPTNINAKVFRRRRLWGHHHHGIVLGFSCPP